MKKFGGKVLFLDRSDINTDEIIPAKYLNEIRKEDLQPFLLEDLELEGFDPRGDVLKDAAVVISRANFGCGSSREHAPWALEMNGITMVIAESFARIFRQNMFNCGMLAIELPTEKLDPLFGLAGKENVTAEIDLKGSVITVTDGTETRTAEFELLPFDRALVDSGGWVDFADKKY